MFPKTYSNDLTVLGAVAPRWSDKEKIRIDCDLTILVVNANMEGYAETMPFTACPWDTFGPHCPEIFEYLAQGNAGPVAEWQRPDVTPHDLQVELDAIWPDIVLGIATPEQIDLAQNLRKQIKAMTP